MNPIRGRVRKFGDNIDTDTIIPGSVLHLPINEMVKYAFSPIYPEFYKSIRDGDMVLAGKNFGCGSSRQQAVMVLKELGIRFVMCESMARIYFRNCVSLGIYPIITDNVTKIFDEGDEVEIHLDGLIKNLRTGDTVSFVPLSGKPLEVWEAGGIMAVVKKMVAKVG